jgi:hypothetical protein
MFSLKGVRLLSVLSRSEYPLLDLIPKKTLFALMALGLLLALLCPNILRALGYRPESERADIPVERYPLVFIFLLDILFILVLKHFCNAAPSEFLYFNF